MYNSHVHIIGSIDYRMFATTTILCQHVNIFEYIHLARCESTVYYMDHIRHMHTRYANAVRDAFCRHT
jgi:hypothetical protein